MVLEPDRSSAFTAAWDPTPWHAAQRAAWTLTQRR